ncbi:MAG TPA: response regulator [Elusimicrobiota bacterium]|nr:response regulator [Elusimicrobiota bacterium]
MARILVVDDEESIREVVRRLLSLHGHTVETAVNGAEALDRLQNRKYDLMIIDRFMPKMSGVDAVAVLRTSPKFKDLKILMVTMTSTTKDVNEAFDAGVDGYVVKPFDMNKLLEKVNLALLK